MKRFIILSVLLLAFSTLIWSAPKTIIFYTWDLPEHHTMVDTFNASQKDIFVDAKYIPTGDYEAKISTLLAGGVQMDVYMEKRQADSFAHYANGYVLALDDLIKKNPKIDTAGVNNYLPGVQINGKIIGIPFRGAGYYVYFNKKIFEKASVPTPDTYVEKGEWTWAKFVEISKKISSGDGKTYGSLFYIWSPQSIIPLLQKGTQFITSDKKIDADYDLFVKVFKMKKDLEQSKAVYPHVEMKVTKTHYSKAFYTGTIGMLIIGEWFPSFMTTGRDKNLLENFTWNDWGVTRIPCDEKIYTTFGNPTFNIIHPKSKNKEAAFKFITWLGGPEGAKVVAKAGNYPPVMNDDIKAIFKQNLPDDSSLKYFTEQKKDMPQLFNKYGSKIELMLNQLVDDYLTKTMSDDELKSTLKTKLEEIIKTSE